MYIWIWVTIAAALSQSLRTAQQKNLQPVLGNLGASFVRFSYAASEENISQALENINKMLS